MFDYEIYFDDSGTHKGSPIAPKRPLDFGPWSTFSFPKNPRSKTPADSGSLSSQFYGEHAGLFQVSSRNKWSRIETVDGHEDRQTEPFFICVRN